MLRIIAAILILWAGCEDDSGGGCGGGFGSDEGQKPVIDVIRANRTTLLVNDCTMVHVEARDLNDEDLDYVWSIVTSNGGQFETSPTQPDVQWRAPSMPGNYVIRARVNNESQKSATRDITLTVSNINSPIVQIPYPTNGQFISASAGTVIIQGAITNLNSPNVDSVKCYINGTFLGRVLLNNNPSFNWNVTGLNGSKVIKLQAWTHFSGPTTTDSALVNVSIEGTIGKH